MTTPPSIPVEDHYRELVARCLSGLASAGEEAELQRRIAQVPANAEYFHRMRRAWEVAGAVPNEHDAQAALDRVMRRAQGIETPVIPLRRAPAYDRSRHPPRAVARWSALARTAAVLVAVIGGAVIWRAHGGTMVPRPALESYATAAGQRATLTLSDGSRILLGPESELRVPNRFPRSARVVHLQGTALFEVTRDPRRPFQVHSEGVLTQVLGTRFVVRAYAGEERVDVAVVEGRVGVRAEAAPERDGMVLNAGELGQVDAAGVARHVRDASVQELLDWTEGRLVFRDLPLHEVARELERWYGMEIRIPDPELAARHVTLSFQDAPVAEVLEALRLSLHVRYQRDGRTATLHPR